MSNDCNYQNILNNKLNECAFVTENCPTSLIPFYEIHYCNFDGLIYFTIPTFLIIGRITFYYKDISVFTYSLIQQIDIYLLH